MKEVYIIEYDNGEPYEDNHTYNDCHYFESEEEAIEYLNFNNYYKGNRSYYAYESKFNNESAKIIQLSKADMEQAIEPFDKEKYESVGLVVKDYKQLGRQYEINFAETMVSGVKVEGFTAYSEMDNDNLLSFDKVAESVEKLKKDLKAGDQYELVFDGIQFEKMYMEDFPKWLVLIKTTEKDTGEFVDDTHMDIDQHFDEEEYQYQLEMLNRILQ